MSKLSFTWFFYSRERASPSLAAIGIRLKAKKEGLPKKKGGFPGLTIREDTKALLIHLLKHWGTKLLFLMSNSSIPRIDWGREEETKTIQRSFLIDNYKLDIFNLWLNKYKLAQYKTWSIMRGKKDRFDKLYVGSLWDSPRGDRKCGESCWKEGGMK